MFVSIPCDMAVTYVKNGKRGTLIWWMMFLQNFYICDLSHLRYSLPPPLPCSPCQYMVCNCCFIYVFLSILYQLPQQENFYDCGLFLLHYVERFLEEAPIDFSPFKITKFSNFVSEFPLHQ